MLHSKFTTDDNQSELNLYPPFHSFHDLTNQAVDESVTSAVYTMYSAFSHGNPFNVSLPRPYICK